MTQHKITTEEPLTWTEARSRLRTLLLNYMKETTTTQQDSIRGDTQLNRSENDFIDTCLHYQVDSYTALLLAAIMLIVSSLAMTTQPKLHAGASKHVYRAQLAAAVLLVTGSMGAMWLIQRRRFLSKSGSEHAKKREVFSFIRAMEQYTLPPNSTTTATRNETTPTELTGSPLTGIYPVYRRDGEDAAWSRIPGQLLVQGDIIALQVGDVAPACCESIAHPFVSLQAGQRITLQSFRQSVDKIVNQLPQGRTTIPPESHTLLALCNRIRIVRVVEAPLQEFLHRSHETMKTPVVSRQIKTIRKALAIFAPIILALTSIVVFSRPQATTGDLALIIPVPILATISLLPMVGPIIVMLLEILGTARILTVVHPYARKMEEKQNDEVFPRTTLLVRYVLATTMSRLSLWGSGKEIGKYFKRMNNGYRSNLVRVPPASHHVLETLGTATALTLVDDELACEPHAIPQQLLIPSSQGLKLLDLCPAYDDDSEEEDGTFTENESYRRRRGRSFDSDSESEEGTNNPAFHGLRRKILRRKTYRRGKSRFNSRPQHEGSDSDDTADTEDSSYEVQFEDPMWWQYLPSLKCIGLSCLLVEETRDVSEARAEKDATSGIARQLNEKAAPGDFDTAKTALVHLICAERRAEQLRLLAECIGFKTTPNSFGERGDLTPFKEKLRLHVLSDSLFRERLVLDAHERSSEQSRWWGLLRPDSTSVVIEDSRSQAYQILTVGDPAVVMGLCNEAWQGEISTILPLAASDRQTVLQTSRDWKLADLDVSAFGFSPIPHNLEKIMNDRHGQMYLLDNGDQQHSISRDKNASNEWSLIRNQIFLGLLGSLVVPRREIQGLLSVLSDAGVRFVYFSPRNMRRQKELASQMGIDVAWNCAISLRPLESGKEDPHRMVSNYADWDVNAKLPHGVDDVRKHLQEVDNVPLLVSLYTDVTKKTIRDMVEIFQEYHDTVIAIGLSHLTWNAEIFGKADIAISIDILTEHADKHDQQDENLSSSHVIMPELEFVSRISSHACAFRFRGAAALSHMSPIIDQGRAALEAVISAGLFLLTGSISYSLFVLFAACTPAATIPYIPALGSFLFLQFVLSGIGLSMSLSKVDPDAMKRVPAKNDQSITFGKKEGWRLYQFILLKALPPALLPQLLYLIAFGELMLTLEPALVASSCPGASGWVDIVRCEDLRHYSGPARISSGVLLLSEFSLCVVIGSAAFVRRFASLREDPPWECNHIWAASVVLGVGLTVVYIVVGTPAATRSALPWYYYLIALFLPLFCVFWNEVCKSMERKHDRRAEKLRRLQFETRLGAWSPK